MDLFILFILMFFKFFLFYISCWSDEWYASFNLILVFRLKTWRIRIIIIILSTSTFLPVSQLCIVCIFLSFKEINTILGESLSSEDEEKVLEEFENMLSEVFIQFQPPWLNVVVMNICVSSNFKPYLMLCNYIQGFLCD